MLPRRGRQFSLGHGTSHQRPRADIAHGFGNEVEYTTALLDEFDSRISDAAAATDSLIATGPVFAALALARSMRSDSVAMAVMERAVRDTRQVNARSAWGMYALLGPRLRADPRLKPTFRALGYPDVTASK